MRRSFAGMLTKPSASAISQAVQIGFATNILRAAPAVYTFSYINRVIVPALRHRHIKFYFDAHGNEVAFVVWAFLAPGVERQFVRDGEWDLHLSEWNEGAQLWILDLVAPHGHFRHVIDDLAENIFPEVSSVRYGRFRRGRMLQRTLAYGASHRLELRLPE